MQTARGERSLRVSSATAAGLRRTGPSSAAQSEQIALIINSRVVHKFTFLRVTFAGRSGRPRPSAELGIGTGPATSSLASFLSLARASNHHHPSLAPASHSLTLISLSCPKLPSSPERRQVSLAHPPRLPLIQNERAHRSLAPLPPLPWSSRTRSTHVFASPRPRLWSPGIGRATSEALARAGYRVVLSGRRQTELDASLELCLAASSSASKKDDFLTVTGDVSDEQAVRNLFEQAVAKFGRVDVVFNVSRCRARGRGGRERRGPSQASVRLTRADPPSFSLVCARFTERWYRSS